MSYLLLTPEEIQAVKLSEYPVTDKHSLEREIARKAHSKILAELKRVFELDHDGVRGQIQDLIQRMERE